MMKLKKKSEMLSRSWEWTGGVREGGWMDSGVQRNKNFVNISKTACSTDLRYFDS